MNNPGFNTTLPAVRVKKTFRKELQRYSKFLNETESDSIREAIKNYIKGGGEIKWETKN